MTLDSRHRQFKRYFVTLALLVAAFLCYVFVAVPSIEGPRRVHDPSRTPSEFDAFQFKAELVAWLPEDAWERQPCKQISTRTGNIFFQEYHPHDDGRVEVRPLTIILTQAGAAPGQPPIILRALEGAILKLDQPLSLGGTVVQMESGQLIGPVTLYRAATRADGQDEWVIETSQIQLNKQKIQTIQDVDFRFGPHVGHGRNLILELEADPLRAQQAAMTGIRGARRVELVQIDRLHLVPSSNAEPENAEKGTEEENRIRGLTPRARQEMGDYANGFEVTCSGPFEFDLQTNLATLSDNVKIVSCDHADDWLSADQIALQIGSAEPADGRPASESASMPEKDRAWALQSIEARGQPAVLNSGTRQLLVRGERLKYSLAQQTVEIAGRRGVELRQADLELTAADALYQITANGSLGAARIAGPGAIRRGPTEQQPPLEIHWQDLLTIAEDAGQKLISLHGNAKVLLDGQSQLSTDQLRLWLWELPISETPTASERDGDVTATEALMNGSPNSQLSSPSWSWHPDRLLASGRVHLESARMTGNFHALKAQWPRPDISKAAAAPLRSANASAAVASPQEQKIAERTASPIAPAQAKPESKVSVWGKSATIQLLEPTAGTFREVVIEEDVRVEQAAPDGAVAWDIRGQRLQITPQDEQRFRLAMSGSPQTPTRVQAQKMQLASEIVQLDQTANRLWIDGPGHLRAEQVFPREESDSPESASGVDGTNAAKPMPTTIDVKWTGGMVFNGQQIYLESNVVTTSDQSTGTGVSQIETHSEAINLTLTSFVDLSGAASTSQPIEPEIELLTLIGKVSDSKRVFKAVAGGGDVQDSVELLRQSFDADKKLISRQKMTVPWGQVNAVSGELKMQGPGAVSLWSIQSGSSVFQPTDAPIAQEPLPVAQLTNTHVRFDTSLTGNIRQSELLFAGKVRTLHGPIADWNQSLDADRAAPSGDYYRLRSDRLQITQWRRSSADSAHLEIIAIGQAQLEGETFEALAERIGYNQSQEKVILEGDPRGGAQLTYQTTPSGPRNPLVASKIAFNLRDNTTQVEGFKHGVLTTGPIMKRR